MTQPNRRIDPEVEAQLGLAQTSGSRARRAWVRRGVWVLVALALLAGFAWWRARGRAERAPRYVTAPVERGDLAVTVTATGTLSALDTVEVSSEVSGRVAEVMVDFNDRVRRGPGARRAQPRAGAGAVAGGGGAGAGGRPPAWRGRAPPPTRRGASSRRAQELSQAQGCCPRTTSTPRRQRRAAPMPTSAPRRRRRTVARASLDAARSALRKTSVVSPIDGIVLSRSVEPGQTVAASLQAPVLFTLAETSPR